MTMDLLFRAKLCIGGGWAQAGASMVDTAATDATNVLLQQQAQQFNAQQSAVQRDWSAAQAQKQMDFNSTQAGVQRQFADEEQQKAEAYNTQMSNTAIQRRSDDIRAAGFNPLLAVGQLGGASTPQMGAPSSSAASAGIPGGSAASSPAPAQVQGLLSNAANLNLANAQAANVRADTKNKGFQGDILEGQASVMAMETTPDMMMKRQQALAAKYDLDYATASEVDSAVATIRNGVKMGNEQIAGQQFANQLASMSVQAQRATLDTLIAMRNAVQEQQTQEAKNVLWVQGMPFLGKTIATAQAVLTPVSSAASAAGSAAGAAKDLVGFGGALVP